MTRGRRSPGKEARGTPLGGALMALGGLGAIAACVWYIARALSVGHVVGRWGVHPSSSLVYALCVGGAGLGVLLGVACIALGWRWLNEPASGR